MKPVVEKEFRVLIAKMRVVCEQTDCCTVAKARQPSQLDCTSCILSDMDSIITELVSLRDLRDKMVACPVKRTKLEAVFIPETLEQFKKENEGDKKEEEIG